ncbi:MAG: quinate 5-dehydrogenase [bacterium]
MKRVLSVSLGSSKRDHKVEADFGGEKFDVERRGVDGDLPRAIALIRELDGQVDAFGLGGIDLYLRVCNRRYIIQDALKMYNAAKKTPVVDGSGVKYTLEKKIVAELKSRMGWNPRETPVLLVSGVDRFGMAEAFEADSYPLIMGDFMFALDLPVAVRSLRQLCWSSALLLPILTRLPFTFLYPTGSKQETRKPKFTGFFERARVIAGDFLYIRKYSPDDLRGKTVVTNTTTSEDVQHLIRQGVSTLVTTTPVLNGRSFGTNVLEACLVAYVGYKGKGGLRDEDYDALIERLDLKAEYRTLNSGAPEHG